MRYIRVIDDNGMLAVILPHLSVRISVVAPQTMECVDWPRPDRFHLASAMFCMRRFGWIPSSVEVAILPDLTLFEFDAVFN